MRTHRKGRLFAQHHAGHRKRPSPLPPAAAGRAPPSADSMATLPPQQHIRPIRRCNNPLFLVRDSFIHRDKGQHNNDKLRKPPAHNQRKNQKRYADSRGNQASFHEIPLSYTPPNRRFSFPLRQLWGLQNGNTSGQLAYRTGRRSAWMCRTCRSLL